MNKYDVVILGGGTSGCACAYNCAILGLKTLLVEKNNFLGGLMTGGLVVPVMDSSDNNLNNDYYKKLVETAKNHNAQISYKFKNKVNDGWFNPEVLKIVLVELLTSNEVNNNLEILFESDLQKVILKDDEIESIILNSNMLSLPIVSTSYVDATGCGILAKMSGCGFLNDNNIKQQNSLRFILSNVDTERFCDFITNIDLNRDITNTYRNDLDTDNELHFTTASTWDTNAHWALDKYLQKGVEDGILFNTDRSYFQIFSVARAKGEVAFNCPRINNYQEHPYKSSIELVSAYKAILRLYNFVKKYFPGFNNAVISNIACITGVREQGRVKTKYTYTIDDLKSGKAFNNAVLCANYPIDIHSDKKDGSILQKTAQYQLPIESLMSYDIQNLYIIGKIVGADFQTHSALRVQKSCMAMGEAVAKYIFNKKTMPDNQAV